MFSIVDSRPLRLAAIAFVCILLAACSTPTRLPPVPAADTWRAQPLGIANARFFALGAGADDQEAIAAGKRRLRLRG